MTDPVHRPSHYTAGAVECIDAIEAALGREGFIAFLRGQVIKYQWRLGIKDAPEQDGAKAHWYSTRLQAVLAPAADDGWVTWAPGDAIPVKPVFVRTDGGWTSKGAQTEWAWDERGYRQIVAYKYP